MMAKILKSIHLGGLGRNVISVSLPTGVQLVVFVLLQCSSAVVCHPRDLRVSEHNVSVVRVPASL